MTDTPPETAADLPEWAMQPIYPSVLFGGTRGEVWTAAETGVLFVGFAVLSDGVSTLRGLLATPTAAPDDQRSEAITDASEWINGADQWMKTHVTDHVSAETDRAEVLLEITWNIGFLLESVGEHINRLGYGPTPE